MTIHFMPLEGAEGTACGIPITNRDAAEANGTVTDDASVYDCRRCYTVLQTDVYWESI